MSIKKLIIPFSVVIVMAAGFIYFASIPRYNETKQCCEASKTFIESVVNNNLASAKKISLGRVLWQLGNTGEMPKSKALSVDAQMVYLKGNTAKTLTVCEMTTDSGLDVAWYDLYLLKEKGQWKIYKISETTPDPWGIDPKGQGKNILGAEETAKKFILAATTGKSGLEYLAGPARKSYEQTAPGLIKDAPKGFKLTPLYSDEKSALYRVTYILQGRTVDILFSLYKLDTWRIVAANQL